MSKKFVIKKDRIRSFANIVLSKIAKEGIKLVLLKAEVGAGKTTLTREILKCLGHASTFQSPTFVVSQEYKITLFGNFRTLFRKDVLTVEHTDFYRVTDDAYIALNSSESECDIKVFEWSELANKSLKTNSNTMLITITHPYGTFTKRGEMRNKKYRVYEISTNKEF